ncbi:MAG TPA: SAM-dependent chlorinase/fluorinase [Bacteroidales bacterium]|nr:SAM-dependent chlorinase/fluorinase [Bacteroidales bacterium]
MSIITITSDWNSDDFYTAALKGRILSLYADARIIDISNQVPAFNVAIAAFQLKHSYRHFPAGTVHIIAVNSENIERPAVAVKANDHFFVGNDNGIFGLLLEDEPEEVVSLEVSGISSFPELAVFADAASKIASSGSLKNAGKPYKALYKQVPMLPAIEESVINGSVIYIDSYKNAITNISLELFERIGKGRQFEIYVQSNHYKINRINKKYGESTLGEMLALFNSIDLLEIAINRGNAADLLNLSLNSPVRIKFK